MRILINALSGIGDAIMFSPALSVLKKHLPDSEVDMLVMFPQVEQLYRNNPDISRIHFVDFMKQSKLRSLIEVLKVRRNHYDHSINVYPSNRKEYNLVQYMLGARNRIAVKYDHVSRSNWDYLNNTLKKEELNRHNALENFDMVKLIVPEAMESELGAYQIHFLIDEMVFAKEFMIDNELLDKFLVGFHAGSAVLKGHINKRWAAEKYIKLANQLHTEHNAKILLFGTENDVNGRIYEQTKEFSYIPATKSIMESLALMKKCRLFVSNDTALMHLAAGLKVPQVAIFGYTNYRELYPWMNRHEIIRKELPCSPCFYNSPRPVTCIFTGTEEFKCKKTVEVEEVFAACGKLIEEVPRDVKSGDSVK
jgi:heptosyltransferase II